jgi:hypothetical protein
MDKRVRDHEAVPRQERERTLCAHCQTMLQTVLNHGIPEGVSREQLQVLLEVPTQMSEEERATEQS